MKELKLMPEFVEAVLALEQSDQFIFQAYSPKDIKLISKVSPSSGMILTLYRMGRPDSLLDSIEEHRDDLVGITMPISWAFEGGVFHSLVDTGLPVYLHGSPANINSRALHAYFGEQGVSGFYLD